MDTWIVKPTNESLNVGHDKLSEDVAADPWKDESLVSNSLNEFIMAIKKYLLMARMEEMVQSKASRRMSC